MQCPQCQGDYPYQDQGQWVCPECGHEWDEQTTEETEVVYRDSVGNVLAEGDRVTLVKDLKVKGTSQVLKIGTKAKIGRFVEGDHDIDCKVEGAGPMMLKTSVVKKA